MADTTDATGTAGDDTVFERGSTTRPDGAVLATYAWVPAQASRAVRGVIYLAHGMAEHAGRYDEFARFLAGRGYAVYSHDHRGHGLTATAIFGEYNRPFAPARTDFDWLSRDPAAVDDYVADPLCGFVCTAAFYRDLLAGVARVNSPANLTGLDPALPVLLIAGDADGVGDNGRGVRGAAAALRTAGLTDVTCVLYRDARHELLNETNKEVVMDTIANWLDIRLRERAES